MPSPRTPTVHVPPADHIPVFHTTPRCRHCPPSSRAVSQNVAHLDGFVECEACYEDRVRDTDVPFVLVFSPQTATPLGERR